MCYTYRYAQSKANINSSTFDLKFCFVHTSISKMSVLSVIVIDISPVCSVSASNS